VRLQEYKEPSVAGCSSGPSSVNISMASSSSSGSTVSKGRLPPIQEFQKEYRTSREKSDSKDKPSASSRIRFVVHKFFNTIES